MHQFWQSRHDGEYFNPWKILKEFPDKFREYYRMNIKISDYILDSVREDLISESGLK
jgi:hypothetical protein